MYAALPEASVCNHATRPRALGACSITKLIPPPKCPARHPIDVNSVGLMDINLIHYSEWDISMHTRHFDFKSMTCAEINEFPQCSDKSMGKQMARYFYIILFC
jgi:hypothetical protein